MKGFFPQGVVVLSRSPITLSELRSFFAEHPFLKENPAADEWAISGENAVIAYRPEVNGYVSLDTVPRAWPDAMGDPKTEPMLFASWSMGHFGPHTFPGNLERAVQQAWHWPEAKESVPTHGAFLRLRLSYVLGAGPDAKVFPADRDPRHELEFLLALSRRALLHPEAICYFNPGGEVVANAGTLRDSLDHHARHELPALDLLSNVRLFNLNAEWLVMDTVGNAQLETPDHEAVFPKDRFEPQAVSGFLRNASLYILKNGEVVKNNDTMNGPGGVNWQAMRFEDALTAPPRRVYCWVPCDEKGIPGAVTDRKIAANQVPAAASVANPAPAAKRPWWRFGR